MAQIAEAIIGNSSPGFRWGDGVDLPAFANSFTLCAFKNTLHSCLMGQLNFFMTEDEIVKEVNNLVASGHFLLFDSAFFNQEVPDPIGSLSDLEEAGKFIIWIKNKQAEPKCTSQGRGRMTGKYLFDINKDPIIELDIGRLHGNVISPGRLYYKTGRITNEELRDFHTRATLKIVRTFKKNLITTERLKPFYISRDTVSQLDEGYELELGKGGMKVSKINFNGT